MWTGERLTLALSGGALFANQNLLNTVVLYALYPKLQTIEMDHWGAAVLRNGAQSAEYHSSNGIIIFVLRKI